MKTVLFLLAGFWLGSFISYLITGNYAVGFIALISAIVTLALGLKVVSKR